MVDKKILLVDDDADLRLLLESALRILKYEFESVDGGFAAIDKASQKKFALIIMDWHMPDLDGFEVSRKIWAESKLNRDTKIIVFTSSDTPEEVARCQNHGFADVLSKSFEMQRLVEIMDKHFPTG
jgi:CheY-like chemotaxis protein